MAKRGGGAGAKKPGNGGVKIGMKKGGVQKAKATKAKPMQGVKGTLKSKMQQAGKSRKSVTKKAQETILFYLFLNQYPITCPVTDTFSQARIPSFI